MADYSRLNKLAKPVRKSDATFKVYAKASFYRNSVRVYVPNQPYEKKFTNLELTNHEAKVGKAKDRDETDIERSLRRTKKTVFELCFTNLFDLFITFTFKADRHEINKSKQKLKDWIKNETKQKGKFEYLVIPEYHKDGALHFHALLAGYKGKIKKSINPKTGKPLFRNGKQRYSVVSYQSGFTDAVKIGDTPEDSEKLARYIAKYITKDMPNMFGKNRYWASHGLKRPFVIENPPHWYETAKPSFAYPVEEGVIMYFNFSEEDHEIYDDFSEISDVVSMFGDDD